MSTDIFCIKCQQMLGRDSFYPAYAGPGRRRGTCKSCGSKRTREWNIKNKDRASENLAAYHERRSKDQAATPGYLTDQIIHCQRCERDLPVENFYKSYVYKKTTLGKCKDCSSKESRAWKLANPERALSQRDKHMKSAKARATKSAWGKKNRKRLMAKQKKWIKENPEKWKAITASGRVRNKEKIAAQKRARAARRGREMPKWANKSAIQAIYAEARRMRRETGLDYHVDHIIPLYGKTVSGLHVEGNLQILTASENCSKGNKFNEATISGTIRV